MNSVYEKMLSWMDERAVLSIAFINKKANCLDLLLQPSPHHTTPCSVGYVILTRHPAIL